MRLIRAFVLAVDALNEGVGRALAWLTLGVVVLVFLTAALRYGFGVGGAALYEGYVWLHGIILMGGAGYCLAHDAHVRIDVFYGKASVRRKALIDLFGVLFLLLPTVVFVFKVALPYVEVSWAQSERSVDPDGLPAVYALKSMILVFCVLVGLQGMALGLRSLAVLRGWQIPPNRRVAADSPPGAS